MKKIFHKCIALFFLTAIILPGAEKTLHCLNHAVAFSCDAGSQHHFHEFYPSCQVCSFTVPFPGPPQPFFCFSSLCYFSAWIFSALQNPVISFVYKLLPSRAPPVSA